ncbi:MAG: glycosyltransferase family 4 protein [Candidatus Peribacteraceae bacterium]
MKTLVILSAFLSPYRSGAEAMVEEVAKRLSDDFDITIVTGRYSRALSQRDTMGKMKIIRVGLGLRLDKWLYPFLAPMQLGKLHPDIVHAVLETFAGLALTLCRCKTKKVLTLQTTNRTFLKKMIIGSPDIVTAISTDLVKTAESFGRKDVHLIPNGIDLSAFQSAVQTVSKDSGRVLFVGRLEQMKGIDTLLRAFKRAIAGLPPSVHLRIVGDGSEKQSLQRLATELDIDHRVQFVGKVPHEKVAIEFAAAEIFAGLSRSEALGNVFIEAQAAGCAVLGTTVGGIPDTVKDGESGLLVPPNNEEAAALALRQLLTDTPLRARLTKGGTKNAEAYDWNGIAERYRAIYS